MLPIKLVIFNGPKFSGKDLAYDLLAEHDPSIKKFRIKDILYEAVAIHYGIPLETVEFISNDRSVKEIPYTGYRGLTPREALIHVSEDILKPFFGEDWIPTRLAERILCHYIHTGCTSYVLTDGGFEIESEIIGRVLNIGRSSYKVIRLHRNDCNFDGDSRSYAIDYDHDIVNPASLDKPTPADAVEFKSLLVEQLKGFF